MHGNGHHYDNRSTRCCCTEINEDKLGKSWRHKTPRQEKKDVRVERAYIRHHNKSDATALDKTCYTRTSAGRVQKCFTSSSASFGTGAEQPLRDGSALQRALRIAL